MTAAAPGLNFNDIRHGSPRTDYWRGFNDGIDKAEELIEEARRG